MKPCDGLRVLDFSQSMTGNIAAMILSDYGAEVLKVEPPSGDALRCHYAWQLWNRGKGSVVADLKTEAGRASIQPLLDGADVIIESFRPGTTSRLGIDYETVRKANPAVIFCSITGFGSSGPYAHIKGYEGVVAAKTGRMLEFSGVVSEARPAYSAVPTCSVGAMQGAVQGILAALRKRRRTGKGSHVETSLVQGNTAYDMLRWIALQRAGSDKLAEDRLNTWGALTGQVPGPYYVTAVTKDGVWLQFSNYMPHLYMAQMNAMELTYLYADERFIHLPAVLNQEDAEEVWEAILEKMRTRTWEEWQTIFAEDEDISVEEIRSTQDAFDHPQVRFNGHVARVGETEQVGPLATLTRSPGEPAGPAPKLGANDDQLVRGWKTSASGEATNSAEGDDLPLSGVTIIDLSFFYATPFGVALLADYGARVIKVEPPAGDPSRYQGGRLVGFKTTAGKESLAVDLKTDEGRQVFHRLLKQADVLVHNFTPGAAERLGVSYDEVKAINPDIVYHFGAAYGIEGPKAKRPGFHPTAGAVAGNAYLQSPGAIIGENDALLPIGELKQKAWRIQKANEANPDVNAAVALASSILLGLEAQDRFGIGQFQMTTMLCSNLYANPDDAIRFDGKPPRSEPDEDLYGLGPLYRLYKCQSGWVFLACPMEDEWASLCEALGRSEWLSDPRFKTADARLANEAELASALAGVFLEKSADDWEAYLTSRDIACCRADERNVADFAINDPSNLELGFTVPAEHPTTGEYLRHGALVTFDGLPRILRPFSDVGEQTLELLFELGYDQEDAQRLKDSGIVEWPDYATA